jgi:hypothetical protein
VEPNFESLTSLMGSIFLTKQQGHMTLEEYNLANATYVEQHCQKYPVLGMPEIPDQVANYVKRRATQPRSNPYDAQRAADLDEWFHASFKIYDMNHANLHLFKWASEKLKAVGINTPNISLAEQKWAAIERTWQAWADVLTAKKNDSQRPKSN